MVSNGTPYLVKLLREWVCDLEESDEYCDFCNHSEFTDRQTAINNLVKATEKVLNLIFGSGGYVPDELLSVFNRIYSVSKRV